MPRKRLALLAALPLLLAVQPSGAQGPSSAAPVIEAPRQVTGDANPLRIYDIPALAVDPKDPQTVVMAVGDARNGGCGLRVSRDGGLSWATTAPNLLRDAKDSCIQRALGPVMAPAFGSDGMLYVAMPSSSPATDLANGPIDLLLARTADLGVTDETVTVAKSEDVTVNPADYGGQGAAQEGNSWHKFPSLVVDPKNPKRIYAGWRWYVYGKNLQSLSGDVPFRPYFSVSDDGGKTWAKPLDLLAVSKGIPAYGGSAPMLVVAPNGNIYGFSKELLKSPPPGQTNPNPRVLMFKSTDGGQTWSTSVVNDGGPNLQASPEAAVDPRNGNLYVVYGVGPPHTALDKPPPGPQKVFVTTSTDEGKTWTPATKIDDPKAPTDRGDEFYPNVSVASNGRVDVAWYDFRNDPTGPRQVGAFYRGERYWDIYYADSTDAGATWSTNMRVTNPSVDGKEGATFNNIDTRGAVGLQSTADMAYLAWPDSRATDAGGDAEDAYFARIRYAAPPTSTAKGSRPGWVWGTFGAAVTLVIGGLVLAVGGRRARHATAADAGARAPAP
jgi:hypothetical protein